MTQPAPTLADLPDMLTVAEAAAALRLNPETIRRAIRKEQANPGTGLEAFGPMGLRGQALSNHGYRIKKATLEAWYFNLAQQEAQS